MKKGFDPAVKMRALSSGSNVIRVADGYRIHTYAIEDWDLWAIQTKDPSFTVWVYPEQNPEFNKEIVRRFGEPNCRPMASWADSELDIRACVFWPLLNVDSLSVGRLRRHRWSLRSGLTYFREDQAPSGATGNTNRETEASLRREARLTMALQRTKRQRRSGGARNT